MIYRWEFLFTVLGAYAAMAWRVNVIYQTFCIRFWSIHISKFVILLQSPWCYSSILALKVNPTGVFAYRNVLINRINLLVRPYRSNSIIFRMSQRYLLRMSWIDGNSGLNLLFSIVLSLLIAALNTSFRSDHVDTGIGPKMFLNLLRI